MDNFIFDLPDAPEEFGVQLPMAELRRLDFSALDFQTMRRVLVEYIRSYFPDTFNDFVSNNGIIMLLELVAFAVNNLSSRSDILVNESFLPTSRTRTAVDQHLQLINNRLRRQTPATVDVEVSVAAPLVTSLRIPAGTQFSFTGADGETLVYEIFSAPNDFDSDIIILPNTRGVIAFGIEGQFASPITATASGIAGETIAVRADNILDDPIIVEVNTGGIIKRYRRVSILERSDPEDEVYEVQFVDNGMNIKFGDNKNGKQLLPGQEITIRYRIGGGIRGRIGPGFINTRNQFAPDSPANAPVEVRFRNPTSSSGGTDEETIEEAKRRAPRESATLQSAVSGEDYAALASEFSHPVFGSVFKAVSILRSGVDADLNALIGQIRNFNTTTSGDVSFVLSDEEAEQLLLTKFVNRNIVELYVLAEGPDGIPVQPSQGLKEGLTSFFREINVLTDEVRVLNGLLKPINIDITVVVSRSADPSSVREVVNRNIDRFFDPQNFDIGEGLALSDLHSAINGVDGVKSASIFGPTNDIIGIRELGPTSESDQIGANELLVLGNRKIQFFSERGSANQR